MTAVDEVRGWTMDRWWGALDQFAAMGIDIDIRYGDGWTVTFTKGGRSRTGSGPVLREALADFAVKWLESQAEVVA
jgi:hypothetical protein